MIATAALLLWIPVSLGLFTSLPPHRAATISILGGSLLLPVGMGFDLPAVPPLDRNSIPVLCALLGCLFYAQPRIARRLPGTGADRIAILLLLGAPFTALTNADALYDGHVVRSGLSLYDGVSIAVGDTIAFWIPFYVGRVVTRNPRDLLPILVILVAAALLYSLPVLWELRMSPQVHRLVYGYHQTHFSGAHRWSGYRPIVFMPYFLSLALFLMMAAVSAFALVRRRAHVLLVPVRMAAIYLTILIVACKSLAYLVYTMLLIPIVWLAKPRLQILAACLLATVAFAYPVLRGLDIVPVEPMLSLARAAGEDRHSSLEVRLRNEKELLARARERLWFGWGGYDRYRVIDIEGTRSTVDGFWIIALGTRGIIGYWGSMGLFWWPVIAAMRTIGRVRTPDRFLLSGTALIVAVNAIDLLPNTMLTPFSLFVAGSLTGACEGVPKAAASSRKRRSSSVRTRRRDAGSTSSESAGVQVARSSHR